MKVAVTTRNANARSIDQVMRFLFKEVVIFNKLILFLFGHVLATTAYGQGTIDFDPNFRGDAYGWLELDSNSVWQIAKPNKKVFKKAFSNPNVIVTDSSKAYPISDTSHFLIKHISSLNGGVGVRTSHRLLGKYWVNSDTLNDFGVLEYSPNNGKEWIDLLTDTIYNYYYSFYSDTPVLSGNSLGWKNFDIQLHYLERYFNVENGDTVQFRFSFISDNKLDSLDGLMFDDIEIRDLAQSVNENETSIDSKAYPNPCKDELMLEFENESHSPTELHIYNQLGHEVFYQDRITGNKFDLNTKEYPRGIYYGHLRSKEGVSSFKFVKE